MSLFSEAMSTSWGAAISVFGDRCTLNGGSFNCIIHSFDLSDGVDKGRAGRSQNATGKVILSLEDWQSAGGKKGDHVLLPNGIFRILNTPNGATSSTAELDIGPLT